MTGATVRPGYGHPSLNAAAVSDVTLRSGEVHSATSSQRPCHVAHPFHTKKGTAVAITTSPDASTGTIEIAGGTLDVLVDIANSGRITIDPDATLALNGVITECPLQSVQRNIRLVSERLRGPFAPMLT